MYYRDRRPTTVWGLRPSTWVKLGLLGFVALVLIFAIIVPNATGPVFQDVINGLNVGDLQEKGDLIEKIGHLRLTS